MLRQGLAKTLFTDSYERVPWFPFPDRKEEHQWPLLDHLFRQNTLSYLDYVLIHRLLRDYPNIRQEVALFLCHLTLATKEGHLCVRIEQNGFSPSVIQLWHHEEGCPLTEEEAEALTKLMLIGVKEIPEGLMTTLKGVNSLNLESPHTPMCREGNSIYLQRYWVFETLFLKHLKKHLMTPPILKLDSEKIGKIVEKLYQDGTLLKEQSEAILKGCLNSLTLITGGPGTGKTYTAGYLIKVFWEHLSQEQRKSCQIVLAAPTGKAAANLQRSLSRVMASLEQFPSIEAKTLHALLGMKQHSVYQEHVRLTADLLVVDESSMIDVRMMACLFEALKPGSQLILLGDQHQLPSVEAGSIFVDLIKLQSSYPRLNIPSISLSVCLRAELKSLIDFAQLVNQGLTQNVLDVLNHSEGNGIKRLCLPIDKKGAQKEFLNYVMPHFLTIVKPEQSREELLEIFQKIRLLSPVRKGPFGVELLNQLIWKNLYQTLPMSGWVAIPIIITANDYRQQLFNGEAGVLIRRLPLQSLVGGEDYALFPSRQNGGEVRCLSALLLPKYEKAYCLSVHKSQGSEFDRVILVLPEGSELFGREVFYTAVTRARQSIEIYGSDIVISKTVMQRGIRLSGIEERLMTQDWLKEDFSGVKSEFI